MKFKTIREMAEYYEDYNERHPIQNFFLTIKYKIIGLIELPGDFYREVKYFIQRGRRGFSDRDTWDFDYYLSDVIVGGITQLENNFSGVPNDLSEEEWRKILSQIKLTFQVSKYISEGDWIYTTSKDRKKYEKYGFHVMSNEECEEYRKGWRLLNKYYFNLWD